MSRRIRFAGHLVAAALLLGVFYGGALAIPYDSTSPSVTIAEESTDAYDYYVTNSTNLDAGDATPVDELPEDTRHLFEEVNERPPEDQEVGADGWQGPVEAPVCDDALFVCDEYEQTPQFPEDRVTEGLQESVVESEGERYVVRMMFGPGFLPPESFEPIVRALIFGSYGLFLGLAAGHRSEVAPRETLAFTGCGAVLFVAGLGYPYLLMATDTSPSVLHFVGLLLVTWSLILYGTLRAISDVIGAAR